MRLLRANGEHSVIIIIIGAFWDVFYLFLLGEWKIYKMTIWSF